MASGERRDIRAQGESTCLWHGKVNLVRRTEQIVAGVRTWLFTAALLVCKRKVALAQRYCWLFIITHYSPGERQ